MSVTLSPIGGVAGQFFDNNGQPLSGGKIYTYAAGTTTPQACYTSAAGSTPHSNPIILDSAGRVPGGEIWLTDSLLYKFVIETSTAILIGTYDNISGINSNFVNYTVQEEVQTATAGQTVFTLTTINYAPGTNSLTVYIDGVNQYVGTSYLETDSTTVTFTSGLHVGAEVKFTTAVQSTTGAVNADIVTYDPPFTGGVATNVEAKLEQYVSVKDFGAVGDGVTDDTAAIQSAVDAIKSIGNFGRAGAPNLLFPAGTYICSSTLNIDGGNVRLFGENSTIQYTGSGNAIFVGNAAYLTDLTAGYYYAGFENIAIRCTNSAAKCVVNSGYRKIEFINAYMIGGATGLETEGCFAGGVFYNSVCQNQSSHGIQLKQRNNLFMFQSGSVLGSGGNGIVMSTSGAELKGIKLLNMDFEGCAGAINITGNTGNVLMDGLWFENNTAYNLRVDNASGTANKFALTLRNSQITGVGIDILVGTDASGTLIEGFTVENNEFVDSDLVLIGGSVINKFTETNNRFSVSATKTMQPSGLQRVNGGFQPLFEVAPDEPYGYAAVGNQGEIRYADDAGRLWIKTNSASASGGWMVVQTYAVTSYIDTPNNIIGSTISAAQLRFVRTLNATPTTLSTITDGFVGQELILWGFDGGNTTVAHGTNIRLAGGSNFTLGDNDTLHLICADGTKWVEVSRSNNV